MWLIEKAFTALAFAKAWVPFVLLYKVKVLVNDVFYESF